MEQIAKWERNILMRSPRKKLSEHIRYSKTWTFFALIWLAVLSLAIFQGEYCSNCRHISNGTPGTLGTHFSSLPALEIHNHEDANGPALDILHRGGVKRGRRIAGLVLHNYSLGPAIQVDMTGQGGNHQASKKS